MAIKIVQAERNTKSLLFYFRGAAYLQVRLKDIEKVQTLRKKLSKFFQPIFFIITFASKSSVSSTSPLGRLSTRLTEVANTCAAM